MLPLLFQLDGDLKLLWLAQAQHQAIRPVKKRGSVQQIRNGSAIQALLLQSGDVARLECMRRLRQRHRGIYDRIPACTQVGIDTFVQ